MRVIKSNEYSITEWDTVQKMWKLERRHPEQSSSGREIVFIEMAKYLDSAQGLCWLLKCDGSKVLTYNTIRKLVSMQST